MRFQTFELTEHIKYCSALGPLLRGLRRTQNKSHGTSVGIKTIRRLEEGGIKNMADLVSMNMDDLVALGVRQDRAKKIKSYIQRRIQ